MIDCGVTFAETEILMKLEAKFWKHRLNHFVNRLTVRLKSQSGALGKGRQDVVIVPGESKV